MEDINLSGIVLLWGAAVAVWKLRWKYPGRDYLDESMRVMC